MFLRTSRRRSARGMPSALCIVPSAARVLPRGYPSWLAELDRADERLRLRAGVVGVDGDRHRAGVVGVLAIDLLEVLGDVAALGDPLAELARARLHDDVGHRPRLLALEDRAHRGRRVPDVADDPGADGLGKAGPGHVDLAGLVVGGALAGVGARGELRDSPAPFEDGRLLEVDLALDVERDR